MKMWTWASREHLAKAKLQKMWAVA
jgi:hypothetical protein